MAWQSGLGGPDGNEVKWLTLACTEWEVLDVSGATAEAEEKKMVDIRKRILGVKGLVNAQDAERPSYNSMQDNSKLLVKYLPIYLLYKEAD